MRKTGRKYHGQKVIALPGHSRLTAALLEKLEQVLESAPPNELREDLLELYHSYILHEHQALPIHFEKMAIHVQLLIELLKDLHFELKDEVRK